jgi:hypothetical protein
MLQYIYTKGDTIFDFNQRAFDYGFDYGYFREHYDVSDLCATAVSQWLNENGMLATPVDIIVIDRDSHDSIATMTWRDELNESTVRKNSRSVVLLGKCVMDLTYSDRLYDTNEFFSKLKEDYGDILHIGDYGDEGIMFNGEFLTVDDLCTRRVF